LYEVTNLSWCQIISKELVVVKVKNSRWQKTKEEMGNIIQFSNLKAKRC
jgi:hypothetical protein